MRLARGGGVFIVGALGAFAVLYIVWWTGILNLHGWVPLPFLICLLLFLFFFRDPHREPEPGSSPGAALSPADGRVIEAVNNEWGARVSIYLRLTDVHVIRMPLACRIDGISKKEGTHHAAGSTGTSSNARLVLDCRTEWGDMKVSLVTGLLARRIISYLSREGEVGCGDRIGLIRFGSRTEVEFPPGYTITVEKGERVLAGVTPVAFREDAVSE